MYNSTTLVKPAFKKLLRCCASLFLLLCFLQTNAQLLGYRSFRLEEDNEPRRITTLYKNKDGYIYVGSVNGLYKFDGTKFTKIEFARENIKDTVTAIFEDDRRQLWVGFQSGHIARKINNRLVYFEPEEGTPKKPISAFAEDGQKKIWFAADGEGIYYIDNNRLYLVNSDNGLSDLSIHALAVSARGDIIAATDQGINYFSSSATKKQATMIGPKNGLPDYLITSIVAAGNDRFWIGMQDKGVCLYDHTNGKISIPYAAGVWNAGQVNDLLYRGADLWITTEDSGLVKLSTSDNHLSFPATAYGKLKNTDDLLSDNEGNLWIVADNNALVRTAGGSLEMLGIFNKDFFETSHAIIVDRQNNFWMGTDQGLVKYTPAGGSYTAKKYPLPILDFSMDITALYQDVYNNIWVGTMGKGLIVLDAASGRYRPVKESTDLGSVNILSITGTGNTVCASGLEGAVVFDLSDNNRDIASAYKLTSFNNIKNLGSNYIYNVYKDSKQRLWFGTDGKGITLLEDGKFTNYDDVTILKDDHIYTIVEDQRGLIWFSTSNAGIYSFDGKKFRNYGIANGLSSLAISGLKADAFGNIIIIHSRGLDILDPVSGTIVYFNNNYGVGDLSPDVGNSFRDSSGNVFLSTASGVIKYTASSEVAVPPVTVIEGIQLFLKEIDPSAQTVFPHDENNFTFNFFGINYSGPENLTYQYKLEGFDTSWTTTKDRSKAFPRLEPGFYTFKVRSSLSDNFENAKEVSWHFEIKKPFWKQWWFIIACILVGGGLLYWFISVRERNLKNVERLRQEKIQFQFQVLRNQVNPHFLFNSFNTLISTIEDDPKVAVEYVERLSDFFRHIVDHRDKDIISLEEELGLLQNYFFLQQKRYGSSLQLLVDVPAEQRKQIFIPPLTLQLLMENALKHNAVSKETPMIVSVVLDESSLLVRNNMNPKLSQPPGSGMGLQNIISRYELLSYKKITIVNNGTDFIVTLPLLKQ